MKTPLRFAALVALVAAIWTGPHGSLLAAPQKPKKADKNAKPVQVQTTWPLPPEQPRVRYLTTYKGLDDFKTKKTGKWKSLLLGEDDAGASSDAMVKPYGIAVSTSGRVYVTDTASRHVFAFDPDEKTVTFIGDVGAGRLAKPIGVAVDEEGKVFVADATLKRVLGYGQDGSFVIAIGHDGELQTPAGMAVDRTRKLLYVADSSKHQILCYSTVDGASVRTMGKRGVGPGEFNFPTNLFTDAEGRLYVADTMNFRIQIFDAEGQFVRMFGTQGDTPGTFNRPKGVALDSLGNLYVADTDNHKIRKIDLAGNVTTLAGGGSDEIGRAHV